MYTPSPTQSIQARQFQQQMPMQQMQNGLPPQLLQMITDAIAAETVQKATQAAQGQVAQAMGGPQPTVADSVKEKLRQAGLEAAQQKLAMGSNGHAEMQQKAQGLAAIANQGQNVPQAQGAPQGPQPIQRMAAGGLARLPSNLPSSYAGGGIIAFGEQDSRDQLVQQIPSGGGAPAVEEAAGGLVGLLQKMGFSAETARNVSNTMNAIGGSGAAIAGGAQGAGAISKAVQLANAIEGGGTTAAAYAERQNTLPPPAAVSSVPTAPTAQAAAAPTAPLPDGGKGVVAAAAAANKPPRPVVPVQTQPGLNVQQLELSPEQQTLTKKMSKRIGEGIDINPETVSTAAGDRYQTAVAPGLAEQQGVRSKGLAALQALQERQVSERPSSTQRWLELIGKNKYGRGLGDAFAGVSEGMNASKAGYTTQDIANQKEINVLQQAMADAKASNDIGKYKAAEDALGKAVAEREAYTKDATQYLGTAENALARKQAALTSAAERLQAAQLHAKTLAAGGTQMDRAEKQAATARMVALMQQTQTELTSLTKEGFAMSPEDTQRRTALQRELDALKMQVAASIPGMEQMYKTSAAAPAGTTQKTKSGITYTVAP